MRLQKDSPPFGEVVEVAPIREEEEFSSFGCEVNSTEKLNQEKTDGDNNVESNDPRTDEDNS